MAQRRVFLSYSRNDRPKVARLRDDLTGTGLSVWWDGDIGPGEDWKRAIRHAMKESDIFVLCLSRQAMRRQRSGIYPEARDAIDMYRELPEDGVFIVPVRLDRCEIPAIELDATRTLDRLQYVDLFPPINWVPGVEALLETARRSGGRARGRTPRRSAPPPQRAAVESPRSAVVRRSPAGKLAPYPKTIADRIAAQLLRGSFYRERMSYEVAVQELKPDTVTFNTVLRYVAVNRSHKPDTISIIYALARESSRVQALKIDGRPYDGIGSKTYMTGWGLRVPHRLGPQGRCEVEIEAVETFPRHHWEIYTTFLPATELKLSITSAFNEFRFDYEMFAPDTPEPVRRGNTVEYTLVNGVLPNQGIRLWWS